MKKILFVVIVGMLFLTTGFATATNNVENHSSNQKSIPFVIGSIIKTQGTSGESFEVEYQFGIPSFLAVGLGTIYQLICMNRGNFIPVLRYLCHIKIVEPTQFTLFQELIKTDEYYDLHKGDEIYALVSMPMTTPDQTQLFYLKPKIISTNCVFVALGVIIDNSPD